MKKFLTYSLFLLGLSLYSQSIWELSSSKNKMVIPFQLVNNNIILKTKVNDIPLNLILDTGSGFNILFAFPNKDSITFNNIYKIKLTGPGMNEPVDAYISKNNTLSFKNLVSKKLDVILMLEDKYNFTTSIGIPIHGILGSDFFSENIVEIQYDTKKIIVYKKESKKLLKKIKKYKKLPFLLKDKKPYIPVSITVEDKKTQNLDLLIDTGLSDGLWVFEKELNIENKRYINDYLGAGLGGTIFGKKVRFKTIAFSDYEFKNPIISLPDSISFLKKNILSYRDGSIGGAILKRFNIVFNYDTQMIYLNPNSNFNEKFHYNMAGFDVQHNGVDVVEELIRFDLPDFKKNITENIYDDAKFNFKYTIKPGIQICFVRKNSIADKVGLLVEDKIISINNKKAANYKLYEIYELLLKGSNQKLFLEIDRKGKRLNFELFLEEEI